MPERVTQVTLHAFRGIPETFTLDLSKGESCVILGDNGTGKSSIADAFEWYFRGKIEFLLKEGRGDAIRHSGAAERLQTKVSITTTGALGGSISTDASSADNVREVGNLELFLLRGRTLADFVDKTKGEKWKTLAELLGLEGIDQLRRDLQGARNELRGDADRAAKALAQEESALRERVPVVTEQGILDSIRKQCQVAGLPPPESFATAVEPDWFHTRAPRDPGEQRANALQTVLADLRALQTTPLDAIDGWNDFVSADRPEVLPISLYQEANSLLRSGSAVAGLCPLCEQPVDTAALAVRIAATIDEFRNAEQALTSARQQVRRLDQALSDSHRSRSEIIRRAGGQGVSLPELPGYPSLELPGGSATLAGIQKEPFELYQRHCRAWDAEALQAVENGIPQSLSEHDNALMEIGVLRTLAGKWIKAVRQNRVAEDAYRLADRVFSQYAATQHDHLNAIIGQISDLAAVIYGILHPDENISAVTVETVGDKGAELSVNFHGRKERPPHRVLSESHLNSLGLALFLAMAETFNEDLGFLVLDDVVNSFDREHRGRLADLLVDKSSELQFIVLTHDEQFFTRISQRAPAWKKEQFTSWSYEQGPRTKHFQDDRLATEAREALAEGDRIEAAQKGRRALEEFLQEACEQLEARLPFRRGQRNDQRMADEVLSGLRRALQDHAKDLHTEIKPLLNTVGADLQASLNYESHASQGSTSTQEVRDALDRIDELRSRFTCESCTTRVWYSGTPAASHCKCGKSQFPPPPQVS